jgi:uncharacterized damage-inducible protein DinB
MSLSPYTYGRPQSGEFQSYYGHYIGLIQETDIFDVLRKQTKEARQLLDALTEEQWMYRYAEGKWSIKELYVHIIDSERIFAYRALRFGRGDTAVLPGFDQDDYVASSLADQRTPSSILAEYDAVRAASLTLLESFGEREFLRIGTASDVPVSVRALAYIIAGHERHHLQIIREKYFPV